MRSVVEALSTLAACLGSLCTKAQADNHHPAPAAT